jgi:hypothetical protein
MSLDSILWIKIVSDLHQVSSFIRVLRLPPPIKLMAEILLKVALSIIAITITLVLFQVRWCFGRFCDVNAISAGILFQVRWCFGRFCDVNAISAGILFQVRWCFGRFCDVNAISAGKKPTFMSFMHYTTCNWCNFSVLSIGSHSTLTVSNHSQRYKYWTNLI